MLLLTDYMPLFGSVIMTMMNFASHRQKVDRTNNLCTLIPEGTRYLTRTKFTRDLHHNVLSCWRNKPTWSEFIVADRYYPLENVY